MKGYWKRLISVAMLLALLMLSGCSGNGELSIRKEIRAEIGNAEYVSLIEQYFALWSEAIENAESKNDIFVFLDYEEEFDVVSKRISDKYDEITDFSNDIVISSHGDILLCDMLRKYVAAGQAYDELIKSAGTYYGYEGLGYIATELKLVNQDKLKYESINSLNEMLVSAYRNKLDDMLELYFEPFNDN